jgi:hypothetical protein
MNEAGLPLEVRKQYGLVGRKNRRVRNPMQAKLTESGWRRYKLLLRMGLGPEDAFQRAMAVK